MEISAVPVQGWSLCRLLEQSMRELCLCISRNWGILTRVRRGLPRSARPARHHNGLPVKLLRGWKPNEPRQTQRERERERERQSAGATSAERKEEEKRERQREKKTSERARENENL